MIAAFFLPNLLIKDPRNGATIAIANEGNVIISLENNSMFGTSLKTVFKCGSIVTMAMFDIIVSIDSNNKVSFVCGLIIFNYNS